MNQKMMALFDAFHPVNAQSRPEGNQQRGWPDPDKGGTLALALRLIHAPTVFDSLFYTVFPDPGDNAGTDYEQPQYAKISIPTMSKLTTGMFPGGGVLDDPQLTPATGPYLPVQGTKGQGWLSASAPSSGSGPPAYSGYAEETTAESHGTTVAVGLPFITDSSARDLGFATKALVHSSWTPTLQEQAQNENRIGYSVKFIGMDALTGKLQVTTVDQGQKPIANPPNYSSISDKDPFNISHTVH